LPKKERNLSNHSVASTTAETLRVLQDQHDRRYLVLVRYIFSVLVLLLIAVAPAVGQESPRPIFDPDNYGDVRFSDEKARLDHFAKQILKMPGGRGVIMTFAGNPSFRGKQDSN
jgi:hypothetical protein